MTAVSQPNSNPPNVATNVRPTTSDVLNFAICEPRCSVAAGKYASIIHRDHDRIEIRSRCQFPGPRGTSAIEDGRRRLTIDFQPGSGLANEEIDDRLQGLALGCAALAGGIERG